MKKLQVRLLALLVLLSTSLTFAQKGLLRAGAAKADISPPASMFPMDGMQSYRNVHDPLHARVLIMDNGITKAALVTLDLGGVPGGDELLNLIATELKINRQQVLLSATHNHNAPFGRGPGPYYDVVKKGVLQAVRAAAANLQPAEIGYATGKAYINTNRDEKIGAGYHMGYNPEGVTDKTVAVVSIISKATRQPLAIYANYPVHGVVMFRAKTKDGFPEITADLPGATSNYVERHFKDAVCLWSSGAAGDQNPIFMANYNQDHPDVFDTGPGGYAILEVLSRRLGQEIVKQTRSIANTTSNVQFWGKQKTVTCPGRKNTLTLPPGTLPDPTNVNMVDGDPVNIPISLLMLNDIALAGVSGEVFTEIGIHFKEQSLFDRSVMVTIAPNAVGYIPTDAAYLLPSEKAVANRIKPGCAEPAIINGLIELMQEYIALNK